MFFSISKQQNLSFPNSLRWDDFFVDFDNGWTVKNNHIYKGLTFEGPLNIAEETDIEKFKNIEGTFCILYFNDGKIEVIFGSKQKFPLYLNKVSLNNLYKDENNQINVEGSVVMTTSDIKFTRTQARSYTKLNLNDDEIIQKIDEILESKLINFNYNKPFKLYLTGGLDSLLIASYVVKNKINYELVFGEHVDMDHFLCYNRTRLIKNFWAYQTIQHYRDPTILLTGAHGDETLLRDPLQAFLLLKYDNKDLIEICNKNPTLYQSIHCLKSDNLLTYDRYKNTVFDTLDDVKNYIFNCFYTDYQHWHLGNTLFYTIFDDIQLLNLSLNLSYDIAIKQSLDGYVAKQLISRNRPGLLKLLSPLKNVDYYQNLVPIFENKKRIEEF